MAIPEKEQGVYRLHEDTGDATSKVAKLNDPANESVVIQPSARDEAFRTDLTVHAAKLGAKIIVFTGTAAGAGVSSMAANFASALSRDPRLKVLLIEANFRSPSQEDLFEIKDSATLMSITLDGGDLSKLWNRDKLYILPSGGVVEEPGRLFRTPAFESLLRMSRDKFDYVILDTPPISESAESRYLASIVDGVVLVLEAGKTRKTTALNARKKVEDAGGQVIGVILNRVLDNIPKWISERL